jgi:DNA-binding phage protein
MTEVERLIVRVRKFVTKREPIKWRLALKAKLSENSLRDCDKPSWNPRADTLAAVIKAIEDIEAEEVAERKRRRPKIASECVAA